MGLVCRVVGYMHFPRRDRQIEIGYVNFTGSSVSCSV